MALYDPDIRALLKDGFRKRLGDGSPFLIIDELVIAGGAVRADLALLRQDKFVGYEIKSDQDSPARLKRQAFYYDLLFDENYVVCGPSQLPHVRKIVPEYWGICTIFETAFGPEFRIKRAPTTNKNISKLHLAMLLWRSECIEAIKLARIKSLRKNKNMMWKEIAANYSHYDLRCLIIYMLSQRENWRDEMW